MLGSIITSSTGNCFYSFCSHSLHHTTIIKGYDCLGNDSCEGATAIESLPFSDSGSTERSTPKTSASLQCSNSTAEAPRGVFYKLLGKGSCVTATTTESDFRTMIFVYEGSCGELSCKAHEIDAAAAPKAASKMSWSSKTGISYKILVAGYKGLEGNYNITITVSWGLVRVSCPIGRVLLIR